MRYARLKKLTARCTPLAACLVRQSGSRAGYQLTLKQNGKTKTVYVPKDLMEELRASIREQQRIRSLLREITQLELARIRASASAGRGRAATSASRAGVLRRAEGIDRRPPDRCLQRVRRIGGIGTMPEGFSGMRECNFLFCDFLLVDSFSSCDSWTHFCPFE